MAGVTAATQSSGRRRALDYAPAWVTLLLGLLASAGAAVWFWREAEEVDAARFEIAVTNLIERLDTRTERYADQLERFADWVARKPDLGTNVWSYYVNRLGPSGNLPALAELAYATNSEARTLRLAHYWKKQTRLNRGLMEKWLRQPEVEETWDRTANGQSSASPRRRIPDAEGKMAEAVSLFVPIGAAEPETPRANRWRGVIVGTMNWETLTSDIVTGSGVLEMEASAGGERVSPKKARFSKVVAWPFFREKWQLAFHSTAHFDELSTRARAWWALGAGSMTSGLMAAALGLQVRGRREQEAISGELRAAVAELREAREERQQLNHDLHDGTIQSLYALQLGLSRTASMADGDGKVGSRVEEHRRSLTAVIGELRGFILQHESDDAPSGDLAGVLEAVAARLRLSTEKKLLTELSEGAAGRLSAEQAVHLANLAREALSNALRHAGAETITIRLAERGAVVCLEIEDDGAGFDVAGATKGNGLGLKTMAARAAQASGEFKVESAGGAGTRVRVEVAI